MRRTRSRRWGRWALASVMATCMMCIGALAAAGPASAYEEHSFCTGKNLESSQSCGSGNWYIHSAYANGTSAPICLTGPEQVGGGCMHAANEGIFIGASEPYGYSGSATIFHTINQPPTKVYGTYWTGSPPPANPPPPPPTYSWHTDSLGGTITSAPDISSWAPGRLDVFARGAGESLTHKLYEPSTGWGSFENWGGSLASGSGPGAVSWGGGRIDIVGRTSAGTVAHWYWDGSLHSDNLGGSVTSDTDISSWGSGRLDVFARGTTGNLMHLSYEASTGWGKWENWGGSLAAGAGPGAVSWGPGRIDVVGRAPDNSVTHWWWDGSLHTQSLGGSIIDDPDISSWGPNRLDLFARGNDNALYHRFYTAGGWSEWESLGGSMASGPGAVSWEPGRIDVVAKTPENGIAHWWFGH
jgi:hypothetical protein